MTHTRKRIAMLVISLASLLVMAISASAQPFTCIVILAFMRKENEGANIVSGFIQIIPS
jgi:hypothetical protein